jgi:hypothetical protein
MIASFATMMDGPQIYYNFVRPHTALNEKTPRKQRKIDYQQSRKYQNKIIRKIVSNQLWVAFPSQQSSFYH